MGKEVQSHVVKIRENFFKANINIPLLDVIQQIPPYVDFLKDLFTTKGATNIPKMAVLASTVSSVISN